MQRYKETREASNALLRIVLPQLSKQLASPDPVSYALWYECAAGNNPALKEAVDAIVANGGSMDNQVVANLYEKFIAPPDGAVSTRLRDELERILQELSGTTNATSEHAQAYSLSLGGFGAQLKPGIDPDHLGRLVQSMREKTEQMCMRSGELEARLQHSNQEFETLTAELRHAKGEANNDALTGISNRRGFMQIIHNLQMSAGGLAHSCLIAVDIDHFKKCNDTYGHPFGDKVIRNVAQILGKMIKGQDTAARIGGEEYLVLLPDTPVDGAATLAEQIRTTVAAGRISRAGTSEQDRITLSLGVTDFRRDDTIETYIARADAALYASKSAGRNRVTIAGAPK